jgi:transposase
MEYYVGLDVSLQETFICIINQNGEVIKESVVLSEVGSISNYLEKQNLKYDKIGIESGQLSIYLCKGLVKTGLNAICVDARAMANALNARINKNDKNDAFGIANMVRVNLYKEVAIKSDKSCQIKILLGSRRQLVETRTKIVGTIRGLLKIKGIKVNSRYINGKFAISVLELLKAPKKTDNEFAAIKFSIKTLLTTLKQIEVSLAKLNKEAIKQSKNDPDCKLLMTIPGVGEITALTYKSSIDDMKRFKKSATVGAYLGLTPKQYASGEINSHGSISKMGPKECRSMLYEAAQSMLTTSKKKCKLKSWGLKLQKKKGNKKAIVAMARKLSVIMHRMLITKKEFCYQ